MSAGDWWRLDPWLLAVLLGLGVVTVVSRGFFFLSDRPWQLPHWAQRGLQYAPIAALAAVVAPELLMTQGALVGGWADARPYAAAAGAAAYFWRRNVLVTIVAGMAVYLPLRLALGW